MALIAVAVSSTDSSCDSNTYGNYEMAVGKEFPHDKPNEIGSNGGEVR